jgi:natural product biosynthesis luciferase-like monooxygenase protein
VETIRSAGAKGHNVLTHLIGQDLEQLGEKIAVYRDARAQAGRDPATGIVSLMLHTHLGEDTEAVKKIVYHPFREYLRSAVKLELAAADGGGAISGGHKIDSQSLGEEDMEQLLDLTFERYFYTGALMGTPAHCARLIWQLREIGVDEIACLIDFLDTDQVMAGLPYLDTLREMTSNEAEAKTATEAASAFMEDIDE